jgi:NADP-dependent 3-hydroxy acid dehydrogenase YdfG
MPDTTNTPLHGKVAIITGASSGLGNSTATALAAAGAHTVLVARRAEPLHQLAQTLPNSIAIPGDAADPATAQRACEAALTQHGRIDILVNNAGIGKYKSFAETTLQDFDTMMHTNVRSGFVFSQAVLPTLLQQRSGNIVFVSSVAGLAGVANETVYCASKFAQVGFGQALAEELHPYGIKVTVLCPGGIKTEFAVGNGRTEESVQQSTMMNPDHTAASILFAVTQPANVRITQMTVRHMGKQK